MSDLRPRQFWTMHIRRACYVCYRGWFHGPPLEIARSMAVARTVGLARQRVHPGPEVTIDWDDKLSQALYKLPRF